ncbi:FMN-dependent dehydrogenase [Zopfochytrium polystomum]|nr:FMN-dependent dehydrogenase [Zopfochytrium polystomum]
MSSSSSALVCVDDYRQLAITKLPLNARGYYEAGADNEVTLKENVAAFDRYLLRPRVLRDVRKIDLTTTVLGEKLSMPICIAPSAMQCLAHPSGELATAAAAREANTLMTLSTYSTTAMEDVIAIPPGSAATGGLFWFQLYVYENRKTSESIIRRAEAAGYKALVVTVDTPILGRRRNDLRNTFALPPHLTLKNFPDNLAIKSQAQRTATGTTNGNGTGGGGAAAAVDALLSNSEIALQIGNTSDMGLCWENDIAWLRRTTKLKIVLKGIMTAEDAVLAAKWGVDAIVVSNHGGRQLDTVPATIDVLPEVTAALASLRSSGTAAVPEVYVDGGIRRGSDVVKALALGARAVFIGRPVLWGLAAAGQDGVTGVLRVLEGELRIALALLGCTTPREVGPEHVRHASEYVGGARARAALAKM